jgi:hypothetical protein
MPIQKQRNPDDRTDEDASANRVVGLLVEPQRMCVTLTADVGRHGYF